MKWNERQGGTSQCLLISMIMNQFKGIKTEEANDNKKPNEMKTCMAA